MFLLTTVISIVLGLYFARFNIVISIILVLAYFIFVLYRFGKKRLFVAILFFGIGAFIPRIPLPTNEGPIYKGFVIDARDNYILFQSKFDRYYVYAKENSFEIGDYLVIKGEVKDLKINTFESQFNFKDYLYNKGATKELSVFETTTKFHSIIRIHHFKSKFVSRFDENTGALISAFLFNDKDYSNPLIRLASSNNVLFLLSNSGIYLNVLFALTNYLVFLKFNAKKSRIITLLIYLPYAFFSFTKIGTLRVYALYLLKIWNEFTLKKKFIHVELVSILALIFLIIDYHLVYQEAFYIGFLLSMFSPFVLGSLKFMKLWKRRLFRIVLFALLLFPLRVGDGILRPFYLFKYLCILPISFMFLVISMVSVLIPFKKPIVLVGKALTWILEKMDAFFPIRIPFGNWGGTFVFIFIFLCLLLVFYLESVRRRHAKIAGLSIAILTAVSIVPLQEPISNAVYFINVGQGDSIIIKNKSHTVMIDTGGQTNFDMACETLIPFMNKKKITHIDALILTHDDFDHSGAKDSLIENFKVKNVLDNANQFPYKIGDLNIENLNTFNFVEENDKSLVLSLNFMNKKWLFTGDASVNTEEKIMEKYNVDCDILKVGHHGSNTSSSEKFIKATSPKEAIISCGAKNKYNHPNDEIIERLNKYNVKIRRTDMEGTICYFSLKA